MIALLLLLCASAQVPTVTLGGHLSAELTAQDPVAHARQLDDFIGEDPVKVFGHRVRVTLDAATRCAIEVRSDDFAVYLIVRDEAGTVLAEGSGGLVWTHAGVTLELEAGAYLVDVCGLSERVGAFDFLVRSGALLEHSPAQRLELDLEEGQRVIERLVAEGGPWDRRVGWALMSLGQLRLSAGEPEAAREFYVEALAVLEAAVGGPESREVAFCLNSLGQAHERLGEYAIARELLEQSIAAFEELGETHSRGASDVYFNLGGVYIALGDIEEGQRCLDRCLEISRVVFGEEHPLTLQALEANALLSWQSGRIEEARELMEAGLATLRKAVPGTVLLALSAQNLGVLLQEFGEYGVARSLLQESLAILDEQLGPDHPRTLISLHNLATLQAEVGDARVALPYLRRIVASYEASGGPWTRDSIAFVHNLGTFLLEEGDPTDARLYLERALELERRVLGPEHPDLAETLSSLSRLPREAGAEWESLEQLDLAYSICDLRLGPDHPRTLQVQRSLARFFWDRGDLDSAEDLMQGVADGFIALFGAEDSRSLGTISDLALILSDAGRPQAAWETIRRARPSREAWQRRVLLTLTETGGFLYVEQVRNELAAVLDLARGSKEPAAEREAYESLLSWKGRVTRLFRAGHQRLMEDATPEQRGLLEDLRACLGELSRLTVGIEGDERARLEALSAERARLELALQETETPVGPGSAPSFEVLREALPQAAAVVDFFVHRPYVGPRPGTRERWGEARLSVWISLNALDVPVRLDLGPAGQLELLVRRFLKDLTTPGRSSAPSPEGANLKRALWDPIEAHLEGVDRVFISPDSFLGSLPFETLPGPAGSFLIEQYAFVYTHDVGSLPELLGTATQPVLGSLLACGELEFQEPWTALPASGVEARAVVQLHRELFGSSTKAVLLTGSEASEAQLKSQLAGHTVLHLATHGFFGGDRMPVAGGLSREGAEVPAVELGPLMERHPGLLSALVCSRLSGPSEGAGEDGYLTAEELQWLDLSGVQLAVLSACDTGLGSPRSGEGLIGLRRACQAAGTQTVVSSLWRVREETTVELMLDFYENLWGEGMGRQAALRSAQLAQLDRNLPPAAWGAFVLSGEWR